MAKVRLADIAAQVGVSTVTVHNALTGQKGVSNELRARIQKVAGEMGYRPVSVARRQERSRMLKSIGVLIHEKYLAEYTTFYWKMYQELALVATDKNCMAAVEILKHDMEDHLLLPRMVEENQVEGLIVMGEISKDYIHFMKEQTCLLYTSHSVEAGTGRWSGASIPPITASATPPTAIIRTVVRRRLSSPSVLPSKKALS